MVRDHGVRGKAVVVQQLNFHVGIGQKIRRSSEYLTLDL